MNVPPSKSMLPTAQPRMESATRHAWYRVACFDAIASGKPHRSRAQRLGRRESARPTSEKAPSRGRRTLSVPGLFRLRLGTRKAGRCGVVGAVQQGGWFHSTFGFDCEAGVSAHAQSMHVRSACMRDAMAPISSRCSSVDKEMKLAVVGISLMYISRPIP